MTKIEFDLIAKTIEEAVQAMERRLEARMEGMATYFIQQHLLDQFKEEVHTLVRNAVTQNITVWVETKQRDTGVPAEILDQYAAGVREIRVSPQTFANYCNSIMVTCQRAANIREGRDAGRWVAYKDARVIEMKV